METLRYPYRPKAWVMALAGLFFAGCGVVLVKVALNNDRGLIIDGIFRLGVGTATTFYWLLSACCVVFVLGAVLGLARVMGPAREVVLDGTSLSAPRNSIAGAEVTIPLTAITGLAISQVRRERFLTVHHDGGKLVIVGSMLPDRSDVETLADELDRRCAAARERPQPSAVAAPSRRQFGRRV